MIDKEIDRQTVIYTEKTEIKEKKNIRPSKAIKSKAWLKEKNRDHV